MSNKRILKQKINSKKHVVDGITFKSGLELYMYKLLKENNIAFTYEKETFITVDGFTFFNESYEKNKRGNFKIVTDNILPITYTPDFVGDTFIIEVKGRPNEQFPLRWKLFKKYLTNNNLQYKLFVPRTNAHCREVIKIIKEFIK